MKVATRPVPPHADAEIDHGVPLFPGSTVDALRQGKASSPEISRSAILHGHDLLLQGYTVSQVVHGYGDVCQSITDLAVETNASIRAEDVDAMFRPFAHQSADADRTGLGLGLAFSRWAVEANDGRIFARSLPDVGCVFAIELPRTSVLSLAIA